MSVLSQNLDVNLAVNNLLSRDDEGDEDGDEGDPYMSGVLSISLIWVSYMCEKND